MGVMGVTILRNASVLDPEKGELAPGQSVVVEGGRIADVGPGLSGPDDALVLDAGPMAHEAGIPIVYGTDLFADTHDHQLEEFIIRSEVQPPTDLIRAATSTAARLLQLDGQVGVVAPGAFADLLVIDGNPLEDIRVLTTPDQTLRFIMKEGQIYKNQL